MQRTYKVPLVSCGHCKAAIEGAVRPLAGVAKATVDVEAKLVTVDMDADAISEREIVAAIEGAGYPVSP